MSAANDENLKNYVKWLADKKPYLVDDATLAKLAKLDRDKQEDAYVEDLKRAKTRYKVLSDEGLLPFATKGKSGAGGDFGGGGIPDMGLGGGGLDMGAGGGEDTGLGGPAAGGAPPAPIGEGGPPEVAAGGTTSSSLAMRDLASLESEIKGTVVADDLNTTNENKELLKLKKEQHIALLDVINRS
jgi:hypothetical protein